MFAPFPYQNEGSAFLAARGAALLADDPGLGKCLQAIRACDAVVALEVLIICPASVVGTWHREIAKFREGGWRYLVVSYEGASGEYAEIIDRQMWDVLIVDEAHMLKTVTSSRTKRVYGFTDEICLKRAKALCDRSAAVWLLSGTPMPNNPSELYSHLRALRPDLVTGRYSKKIWSFQQYCATYCVFERSRFGEKMSVRGAKNEAELHRKLSGFMLRRRKTDVLKDLPPLRFGEIAVEGDLSAIPAEEVAIVKAAIERGGFDALKEVAGHVGTLRRLTGMAKLPSTIAWVKDWLANSAGQKIVLFAYHRDVIAELARALGDVAVVLDGSKSQHEREMAIELFQGSEKARVFIGQITAAGTGITLTAASDLLFVESSWVPADMQQASQRIHRIGQTESCLVRFAMIPGSIDEDIQRAVANKVKMIEAVIEGQTGG